MLARARCHCMVLLVPRCPGSARTSWAFSPASSPLHRGSLPLPQPSFPTPFPSFLLFPHPSSGPRVPAVLTARVTFHHRILQERDLLDLRMKEVSGKLPGAPLRGPPPPTITSLGSLVPTPPSNSLLHKPLLYPASLALTPCIWSPRFVPRPVPTLSYTLAYSVVAPFLFPPLSPCLSFSVPFSFSAPSLCCVLYPCFVPTLLPYLLSQQLPHVLQRRVGLLKFSQHLWGQVSTCIRRGHPIIPRQPSSITTSKPTPLLRLHPPPDFLAQSLESGPQAPRSGNRELGGPLSTYTSHLAALPRGIWPCPVARMAARASTRTQAVGPMTTELQLLLAPLSRCPIYSRARPGQPPRSCPESATR